MRTLYPSIDPFDQGWLRVSDVHTLYYEQSGNPDGTPVVFLHGGPGVGTVPDHRRFFDPEAYRIVLFDQRGAGRSTPHACLDENTTWHLVDDIERLRAELGINRWVVFGGSWGSTLGVAYAERHPDRVRALVLRGVFLGRVGEIRWFVDDGTRWIFPERYEALAAAVPEAEPGGLLAALYRRLTDPDESVCVEAARAWTTWESSTMLRKPRRGILPATWAAAATDPTSSTASGATTDSGSSQLRSSWSPIHNASREPFSAVVKPSSFAATTTAMRSITSGASTVVATACSA